MKPVAQRVSWLLATVALAGITSFLVSRTGHRHHGSEHDFHRWMHEQLHVTPEQEKAMAPVEQAFEEQRVRLRKEIAEAGRALAAAVRKGQAGSPEIDAALTRLNAAQAELQRATLDHFFAMKDHLEPDQAEKLLEWTHDSLLPD
jgi:Spy/CpxP family protein refolding chaperone